MTNLSGKVAIVTGAAGGLGEAIALSLAECGAAVVCADLRDAGSVVESLPPSQTEGGHRSLQVDVTSKSDFETAIAGVVDDYGRLDVLCNNAGTYGSEPITEASDESFRRQFEVNTWSTFVGCRAAGRVMRDQGAGRLINTASQLGRVARPGSGVYAASKAAVIMLTQALALELGRFGVTANCICPGTMHTAMMTDESGRPADEVAAELGTDVDTAFAGYIDAHIPVGRLGRPCDIGAAAAFLASDDSSFITGSALNVTGGEQVFW
jgi:3-oxoacyl-[acyl-carrier protein] reductase/sorbitol-6-phosphate 2-dehydrogenase